MQSDIRTLVQDVRREPEGRALEHGLDGAVLDRVARWGVAVVRGALSQQQCGDLLAEADRTGQRFLDLPRRVNGVHQHAEQLAARVDDPSRPALGRLVATLRQALASQAPWTGLRHFVPTEARYMRYSGRSSGLGVHRDGKCYALIVCVFSLAGTAPFSVLSDDDDEPSLDVLVHAGDLVLLRAPGLAGGRDGRPRHAVGAPLAGSRVSLTLRMVKVHPRAAPAPPWSGEGVSR
ncbi:MAG: hypothetical protein ACRD0S_04385 [Acidimicrobiales bacterium]